MKIPVEEKIKEAVLRMKKYGIFPETIKQFEKEGLISRSEPPMGAYFWLSEEEIRKVREFEAEYNAVVYSVIRTYSKEIGMMDSYLFVGDHREEWETDRRLIDENEAFAYVRNHDAPWCSEFGSIGIARGAAAGLLRTW